MGGRGRDGAAPGRQGIRARRRDRSVQLLGQEPAGGRHGRGDRPALPPATWRRLSAGDGTKGPRLYDWAYLELADLEAEDYIDGAQRPWTRGLLIRRSLSDGNWRSSRPGVQPAPDRDAGAGRGAALGDRGRVRDREDRAGADHNETRSWHGWHRHVSLVMLAFAMMAVVRQAPTACTSPQKRNARSQAAALVRWSVQEIRRVARRLPSAASNPLSSSPGPPGAEPSGHRAKPTSNEAATVMLERV